VKKGVYLEWKLGKAQTGNLYKKKNVLGKVERYVTVENKKIGGTKKGSWKIKECSGKNWKTAVAEYIYIYVWNNVVGIKV